MLRLLLALVLLAISAPVRGDDWIAPYRISLAIDAAQTYAIRGSGGVWRERNPIYGRMGDAEAAMSVLAVGWVVERLIVAIPDRKVRGAVGWLAVAVEAGTVGNNLGLGITVRL